MTSLLFLLAACTTTAMIGVEDEGPGDGDTDVTGDTDAEVDTDDTAPDANPFAGEYGGTVFLAIPEWGWDVCQGEMAFVVSEAGALSGEGNCIDESSWGEPNETPVTITGEVDAGTGAVTGTAAWDYQQGWGDPTHYEGEMIGQIDGASAGLSWTAEVDLGGGNAGEVVGEVDAEK